MIIGAILQASSFSYSQILVARVITGLGNGLNVCPPSLLIGTALKIAFQTSTVPSYHAECSPAARRGSLIMIEGSLITFGIMVS
jgi:MFS family permease